MKKIGEEIDRGMKNLLGLLRPTPQRDEKAAAAGRQRFMQQIDGYLAHGQRPAAVATTGWAFLRQKSFAMVTLSALLVFVLVIGSGAGVAAAAIGTLPGEALYAVKTFGEDFRLALTADESAEFDLLGSYVERRYSEIDELQASGREVPESTADRLGEQLGTMLQMAANMDDAAMTQSLTDLQDMLQPKYQGTNGDQDRLQDQFQVKSMVQIHKTTRDSWDATALGLSDPEQFRYMYTNEYAGEGPGEGVGAGTGTPAGEMNGPGPEKQTTGTPEETGFGPGPSATPQATGASYGPGEANDQPENSYGPGGSYGTGTPEGDEDAEYGPGPNETEQPGSSYGPGETSEVTQEPLQKRDPKDK